MLSYEDIAKSIRSHRTKSVYILSGEEPYFIDRLTDLFISDLLPEADKDFNQRVIYGNTISNSKDIITEAIGFPMIGNLQLILIREAQQVRDLESIAPYLERIPESTCLVICYKKKLDKRKGLYKAITKLDGLFESEPIKDYRLPDFIISTFKTQGMEIELSVAQLMAEHTGNNLEKIVSEVEKLRISTQGKRIITAEDIETYIGVSKDFNNFELLRALIEQNASKAYQIAYYFAANDKNYPVQMTLAMLYNYFSNLMAVYYIPNPDDRAIAETLKISPYAVRDYTLGRQHFRSVKVFNIIRQIRLSDAASKGVGSSLSGGEILIDLINYILS